jgi:hypothetical protein
LIENLFQETAMVNDLAKCPLCGGFTHIEKPELLAALRDPMVRPRVESYVADLLRSPSGELVGSTVVQSPGREFIKEVHNWNPYLPVWRPSPKE